MIHPIFPACIRLLKDCGKEAAGIKVKFHEITHNPAKKVLCATLVFVRDGLAIFQNDVNYTVSAANAGASLL